MLASKKLLIVLSAVSFGFTAPVLAEDSANAKSETSVKMNDVQKDKKKSDIDNEITNKRLRAELGSKSKYSLSTSFAYYGGSISKPLERDRQRLSGEGAPVFTSLGGSISGRYRIDKRQSITAGTGISIIQPFHSPSANLEHKNYFDKTEVADISLGYSYATKLGNLQMINEASVTYYTSEGAKQTNGVGGGYVANTLLGSIGESKRLQVGLASYLVGDVYSGDTYKGEDVRASQNDYALQMFPFAEYVINDTFNFRTVFQQLQFFHNVAAEKATDLRRAKGAQSVGLGISVSRDVYLYPNFQFSTEELSTDWLRNKFAKNSTVGISATINMF
ncbi:MAG: hypothetical protein H6625_08385 [Bdellovibrionaceae bacterium]|nr:hypothetical protein [Pseudobdellovibrionaceae bacterium]